MGNLKICGFKDKVAEGALVLNTTSRSNDWCRLFSPFMNQGPIELYGLVAHNVENFYQGASVIQSYVERPKEWLVRRNRILAATNPMRYPDGKANHKPVFRYVNKDLGRLSYIDGRKLVYLPAYIQKLDRYCQEGVQKLIGLAQNRQVWLWDFDGYDCDDEFDVLLHDEKRNLGHAFLVRQYCYDIMDGTDKLLRYRAAIN